MAVNCAALTEHAAGKRTVRPRKRLVHRRTTLNTAGLFELADHGTLFLDEIGEVSKSTQAKLLRVLQEREFVRVGGGRPVPCDVRIIAATNRDLKKMMADSLFREDLFYRLSVFPIRVPALRERPDDIPILAEHFVTKALEDSAYPGPLVLAPATLAALTRYPWPGNIRKLQNVIERSVLMSDGDTLAPHHLPPDLLAAAEETDVPATTLDGHERALILKALVEQNWNQSQTARVLGITRDLLRHRIKKYSLQRPDHPITPGPETAAPSPPDPPPGRPASAPG